MAMRDDHVGIEALLYPHGTVVDGIPWKCVHRCVGAIPSRTTTDETPQTWDEMTGRHLKEGGC